VTMTVSNGNEKFSVSATTAAIEDDPSKRTIGWTHTVVYHLVLSTNAPQDLVTAFFEEFVNELERYDNRTYPQEKGMSRAEFEGYFFARDVFVGMDMKLLEDEENLLVGDER
jgi:hypothetical protein